MKSCVSLSPSLFLLPGTLLLLLLSEFLMGELSCSPCFGLNSFSVAGALRLRLFSARIVFCVPAEPCYPDIKLMGENLSKFQRSDANQENWEEWGKFFCSSNYVVDVAIVSARDPCVYQMCEKWSKEDKKYDLFSLIQCWCRCYGPLLARKAKYYKCFFLSPRGQHTPTIFTNSPFFQCFLCLAPRFEEVKQKVNLFDKCFT